MNRACRLGLFIVGLACLLQTTPVLAAGPEIDIPVRKFVLDNGLTVLVHEDRKAPIVAVAVWYRVGSKDEPEGKAGYAHLFEHIMFEGSGHYRGGFHSPLQQAGATELNGTTSFDRTNYFENVPTPALELALWLESDRMGYLLDALNQEKLDQQRAAVKNEKHQADNQPYGRVYYRILKALFPPGHPYRHPTVGSMADLDAASLEDMEQWFRDYYGAANAVLVLAGDIDTERGRELAEKYFGDIPSGPPVTRLKSWVPDYRNVRHEIMYSQVPHIRSYRTWAVPGWTKKDRFLLQLAASVLGDGKNSRLYQALVYELQSVVDVSASLQPFELASLFSIDATLIPGKAIEQVNDIIEQELRSFLKDGPGEDELERAKTGIIAGLIKGLERVGGFHGKAALLAQGELYDSNPEFYKTALSWISHATTTEVRAAAQRWLSDGSYQLDILPSDEHRVSQSAVDRSAGLPPVGDLPDLRFPDVQRTTLRNGMRVVLAERTEIPVVSLSLQFDAGFAADSGLNPGTASFTLAMMEESTRSRSAREVELEADALGAEISTSSRLDTSTVSLSALRENLEPSIELFADVVRNPAFTADEVESLRIRRLALIEQEKSQPLSAALRTLPPLIYGPGHPYGVPFTGSGTALSVNELTRGDLVEFHSSWIRPDNATLFVVGATSLDEITPMLEAGFGQWKSPRSALPRKEIGEVSLPGRARLIIIDKPGSSQSLILAAHLAPPAGVENNIAILMMNDIIGGKSSARVYAKLCAEKQWSYGAYTLLWNARGQRPWIVYAPVQVERTAESISELISEFNRFLSSGPATPEELDQVSRSNVFSLPGQYETSAAVMDALQANASFGRPDDYLVSLKDKYQAVSVEDIKAAAAQVLHPDQITWVIVGDRLQIEDSLEKLEIAELEFIDSDGRFIE